MEAAKINKRKKESSDFQVFDFNLLSMGGGMVGSTLSICLIWSRVDCCVGGEGGDRRQTLTPR